MAMSIPFTEPATMLTDYALGILCSIFGWRLWMKGRAPISSSMMFWAGGMGSLAMASFAGGTVHGWSLMLAGPVVSALWKGTAIAVGFASFCFLAGTLSASVGLPLRRWLMFVPCLQLAGYLVWMVGHTDFRYVIYNYGGTFAVILLIQAYCGLVRKSPSAWWIVAGVSVSYLAAFVQRSRIAPHPSFNHNDLYHVIQMAGVWLLYRGAALLRDR
jgi:type IV secretory pathway TrbD component